MFAFFLNCYHLRDWAIDVVQLAGGTALIGGQPRAWETVGVHRVAGGKIAACWLLPFNQNAFDEIWR